MTDSLRDLLQGFPRFAIWRQHTAQRTRYLALRPRRASPYTALTADPAGLRATGTAVFGHWATQASRTPSPISAAGQALNGKDTDHMSEPYDPRVGYLGKLGMVLLARGVRCELAATGCVPRLQLDIPCLGGFDNAAFEDNIVAADEPDGIWRYWWP